MATTSTWQYPIIPPEKLLPKRKHLSRKTRSTEVSSRHDKPSSAAKQGHSRHSQQRYASAVDSRNPGHYALPSADGSTGTTPHCGCRPGALLQTEGRSTQTRVSRIPSRKICSKVISSPFTRNADDSQMQFGSSSSDISLGEDSNCFSASRGSRPTTGRRTAASVKDGCTSYTYLQMSSGHARRDASTCYSRTTISTATAKEFQISETDASVQVEFHDRVKTRTDFRRNYWSRSRTNVDTRIIRESEGGDPVPELHVLYDSAQKINTLYQEDIQEFTRNPQGHVPGDGPLSAAEYQALCQNNSRNFIVYYYENVQAQTETCGCPCDENLGPVCPGQRICRRVRPTPSDLVIPLAPPRTPANVVFVDDSNEGPPKVPEKPPPAPVDLDWGTPPWAKPEKETEKGAPPEGEGPSGSPSKQFQRKPGPDYDNVDTPPGGRRPSEAPGQGQPPEDQYGQPPGGQPESPDADDYGPPPERPPPRRPPKPPRSQYDQAVPSPRRGTVIGRPGKGRRRSSGQDSPSNDPGSPPAAATSPPGILKKRFSGDPGRESVDTPRRPSGNRDGIPSDDMTIPPKTIRHLRRNPAVTPRSSMFNDPTLPQKTGEPPQEHDPVIPETEDGDPIPPSTAVPGGIPPHPPLRLPGGSDYVPPKSRTPFSTGSPPNEENVDGGGPPPRRKGHRHNKYEPRDSLSSDGSDEPLYPEPKFIGSPENTPRKKRRRSSDVPETIDVEIDIDDDDESQEEEPPKVGKPPPKPKFPQPENYLPPPSAEEPPGQFYSQPEPPPESGSGQPYTQPKRGPGRRPMPPVPGSGVPEQSQPPQPGQPQQPGQPYDQPQQPGQPGQPDQPQQPGQPGQPFDQPQQPGQPEEPYDQPQQPGQPGQPSDQLQEPGQPGQPFQEQPGPPGAPDVPGQQPQPGPPGQPQPPGNTPQIPGARSHGPPDGPQMPGASIPGKEPPALDQSRPDTGPQGSLEPPISNLQPPPWHHPPSMTGHPGQSHPDQPGQPPSTSQGPYPPGTPQGPYSPGTPQGPYPPGTPQGPYPPGAVPPAPEWPEWVGPPPWAEPGMPPPSAGKPGKGKPGQPPPALSPYMFPPGCILPPGYPYCSQACPPGSVPLQPGMQCPSGLVPYYAEQDCPPPLPPRTPSKTPGKGKKRRKKGKKTSATPPATPCCHPVSACFPYYPHTQNPLAPNYYSRRRTAPSQYPNYCQREAPLPPQIHELAGRIQAMVQPAMSQPQPNCPPGSISLSKMGSRRSSRSSCCRPTSLCRTSSFRRYRRASRPSSQVGIAGPCPSQEGQYTYPPGSCPMALCFSPLPIYAQCRVPMPFCNDVIRRTPDYLGPGRPDIRNVRPRTDTFLDNVGFSPYSPMFPPFLFPGGAISRKTSRANNLSRVNSKCGLPGFPCVPPVAPMLSTTLMSRTNSGRRIRPGSRTTSGEMAAKVDSWKKPTSKPSITNRLCFPSMSREAFADVFPGMGEVQHQKRRTSSQPVSRVTSSRFKFDRTPTCICRKVSKREIRQKKAVNGNKCDVEFPPMFPPVCYPRSVTREVKESKTGSKTCLRPHSSNATISLLDVPDEDQTREKELERVRKPPNCLCPTPFTIPPCPAEARKLLRPPSLRGSRPDLDQSGSQANVRSSYKCKTCPCAGPFFFRFRCPRICPCGGTNRSSTDKDRKPSPPFPCEVAKGFVRPLSRSESRSLSRSRTPLNQRYGRAPCIPPAPCAFTCPLNALPQPFRTDSLGIVHGMTPTRSASSIYAYSRRPQSASVSPSTSRSRVKWSKSKPCLPCPLPMIFPPGCVRCRCGYRSRGKAKVGSTCNSRTSLRERSSMNLRRRRKTNECPPWRSTLSPGCVRRCYKKCTTATQKSSGLFSKSNTYMRRALARDPTAEIHFPKEYKHGEVKSRFSSCRINTKERPYVFPSRKKSSLSPNRNDLTNPSRYDFKRIAKKSVGAGSKTLFKGKPAFTAGFSRSTCSSKFEVKYNKRKGKKKMRKDSKSSSSESDGWCRSDVDLELRERTEQRAREMRMRARKKAQDYCAQSNHRFWSHRCQKLFRTRSKTGSLSTIELYAKRSSDVLHSRSSSKLRSPSRTKFRSPGGTFRSKSGSKLRSKSGSSLRSRSTSKLRSKTPSRDSNEESEEPEGPNVFERLFALRKPFEPKRPPITTKICRELDLEKFHRFPRRAKTSSPPPKCVVWQTQIPVAVYPPPPPPPCPRPVTPVLLNMVKKISELLAQPKPCPSAECGLSCRHSRRSICSLYNPPPCCRDKKPYKIPPFPCMNRPGRIPPYYVSVPVYCCMPCCLHRRKCRVSKRWTCDACKLRPLRCESYCCCHPCCLCNPCDCDYCSCSCCDCSCCNCNNCCCC